MLIDLDLWGDNNSDGSAIEHQDDAALNNAVVAFLTSKRGDYINDPTEGGILPEFVFKNMDPLTLGKLQFRVQNALTIKFANLLKLQSVNIIPDFTRRLTTIEITYQSLLSKQNQSAIIYLNDIAKKEVSQFVEITYTGENLYSFVLIKKTSMLGKKLIYNIKELCWIWGENIKFINFTDADPRFSDILAMCNIN